MTLVILNLFQNLKHSTLLPLCHSELASESQTKSLQGSFGLCEAIYKPTHKIPFSLLPSLNQPMGVINKPETRPIVCYTNNSSILTTKGGKQAQNGSTTPSTTEVPLKEGHL